MSSAASRVLVNKAKAALPLIRGALLKRAGANLARDHKLLFAPAPLLDRLSFGQLMKSVQCDRPQAHAAAADLDSTFGFSTYDTQMRSLKEASISDEDEFDDDDSEDFDDELYDEISDEDNSESEEDGDAAPTRRN